MRVIFWDFHGTLAYDRCGWSGTMLHILKNEHPGISVRRETITHLMSTGFPWHFPEKGHTEYNDDPEGWWRASDAQMVRIYNQIGVPAQEASRLVGLFRRTYLESTENFIPFDDSYEALRASRERGFANVILSNHVPELDEIIGRLPFADLIDHIVTSARVGYEKPHPAIYDHARALMGNPETCWMVGDNYTADCLGALGAGFQPVWVHHNGRMPENWDSRVRRADTLLDAVAVITAEGAGNGQE